MTEYFKQFIGPGFTMLVPTDWYIASTPQYQAAFVAPEAGAVKSNVVVSINKAAEGVTIGALSAAAKAKQSQEYPQYQVIDEKDLSKEGYQALERRYQWFNAEHKAIILQRQIIMMVDQVVYTLTTTQKYDGQGDKETDQIFTQMLNTFRIRPEPQDQ
ncbi:MAG: DcrB-related protein [Chloroflexi bacterium]|nr:DcrB-related protein [Chloroflexota bacterium]MBP8058643.1 DcrB-related protein [Chloroflexota bacterium]